MKIKARLRIRLRRGRKAGLTSGVVAFCLLLLWPFSAGAADRQRPPAVNINTAAAEELEKLPAIGRVRAEMIVRIRERNGPFKKVEELRALPRLSERQFEKLRKYVTVGGKGPVRIAREP